MNDSCTASDLGSSLSSPARAIHCRLAIAYLPAPHSLLRILALLGLCLYSAFGQAPTPFAPAETGLVLFRSVVLIDGTGSPERANMDVLVKGQRIEKIFPDAEVDPSLLQNAKVLTLTGRFLMPGLIDAHVHLATPPNRRQAEALLRRDLYGGVTAVRDMADDLRPVGELTRAALVGEIAAPDIYYAALMGGPDLFTDKRTAQTSAGGIIGHVPWMQAVTDSTDLPLAVAQARGTFATAIKLYADLTPELATRITAEAHRQHLLVWAHATLFPARPSQVLAAGVDAISHACLLVREPDARVPSWSEPRRTVALAPFREGRNPVLAVLFAEMARRGTILDPTIWAFSPETADSTTEPPLPPNSCDDVVGGAITGQAYRAGVLVDAGTDNVADWNDPWPDLFHELAALSKQAGIPNSAILKSATSIGALAAGQQRDMGSLQQGKLANMVVLDRDPQLDLNNLRSVVMTVKRGRIFDRNAFVPLTQGDITDR